MNIYVKCLTAFSVLLTVCLITERKVVLLESQLTNLIELGRRGSELGDEEPPLIFRSKPLVIWSMDYHISPIHDLKAYLQPMGVKFIDKSLDMVRCQLTDTCHQRKTLKVINQHNGMFLNYSDIPRFYEAYKNDPEMQSVDAFVCCHASALCELFEPFNKSLVIISTHRYELGRFGKERWTRWNNNLIKYASQPWNVVGANNLYDAEYIKYFTGIQPQYIPSYCGYTNETYTQSRKGFLIAHNSKPFFRSFYRQFTESCSSTNCSVKLTPVKAMYQRYKYSDVAAHQGVVHVPYQVSVMSFFEQYRMNIPLFVPSQELLIHWELKRRAMPSRTWEGAMFGRRPRGSAIEPHPSQRSIPDPNNVWNEHNIRYWLNFCDYYHVPHITYYHSVEHLIEILQTITPKELWDISERMRTFNAKENRRLRVVWKKILLKIAERSGNDPH